MLAGTVAIHPLEMHRCERDKEELVVDNAGYQKAEWSQRLP